MVGEKVIKNAAKKAHFFPNNERAIELSYRNEKDVGNGWYQHPCDLNISSK
jgi:hypothetical protein